MDRVPICNFLDLIYEILLRKEKNEENHGHKGKIEDRKCARLGG